MTDTTQDMLMNEVMLLDPIMQQSYLLNKVVRKFNPIATIQPGSPIEFLVKNSEKLYLDLNNSCVTVRLKFQRRTEHQCPLPMLVLRAM